MQGYKPPLTVRCKPPVQGRTKWVFFAGNLGTREGDTPRCATLLVLIKGRSNLKSGQGES